MIINGKTDVIEDEGLFVYSRTEPQVRQEIEDFNENLVPTWNYVSVHAYGKPNIISNPTDTIEVMRKLINFYESNATGNRHHQLRLRGGIR